MRRATSTLLGLALTLPVSLQAQDAFQGSVTYRMTSEGRSVDATFMSKGANTRMEMAMPGMPGQIVILLNSDEMVARTIMGSMGMYMEMDLKQMTGAGGGPGGGEPPKVEKLGTTAEIAGIRCENYRIQQGSQPESEACIATGMGWFMGMSGMAGMAGGRRGGGNAAGPNWTALMKEFTDGMLPLRVRVRNGQEWSTVLEAVEVTRKALADDLFRLPAGLRKMPGMGGGA